MSPIFLDINPADISETRQKKTNSLIDVGFWTSHDSSGEMSILDRRTWILNVKLIEGQITWSSPKPLGFPGAGLR